MTTREKELYRAERVLRASSWVRYGPNTKMSPILTSVLAFSPESGAYCSSVGSRLVDWHRTNRRTTAVIRVKWHIESLPSSTLLHANGLYALESWPTDSTSCHHHAISISISARSTHSASLLLSDWEVVKHVHCDQGLRNLRSGGCHATTLCHRHAHTVKKH